MLLKMATIVLKAEPPVNKYTVISSVRKGEIFRKLFFESSDSHSTIFKQKKAIAQKEGSTNALPHFSDLRVNDREAS